MAGAGGDGSQLDPLVPGGTTDAGRILLDAYVLDARLRLQHQFESDIPQAADTGGSAMRLQQFQRNAVLDEKQDARMADRRLTVPQWKLAEGEQPETEK